MRPTTTNNNKNKRGGYLYLKVLILICSSIVVGANLAAFSRSSHDVLKGPLRPEHSMNTNTNTNNKEGKGSNDVGEVVVADDVGFLNPDEEIMSNTAIDDERIPTLDDTVAGADDTDIDTDTDATTPEKEKEKQSHKHRQRITTTTAQTHSHACSPEYISLFPAKPQTTNVIVADVSTLAHKKNYENIGAYRDKKIPATILPNSGRDILNRNKNKNKEDEEEKPWSTCALVGNSGHLLKMEYGQQIDQSEIVVRINQAPTKGYEKFVGKRTTHRLLNRLWTIAYHDGSGINKIYRGGGWPLEKDVTLISSRTAAENFVRLAYYVKNKLKRLDVQTLFLMPEVRAIAENSLKRFRRCYERKHSKNFKGGNCASSGLVGIAMLRPLCMNITVFGLGKGQRGDPYQYYRLKQTHRSYGNPVHSFDTEDVIFKTMASDRFITFCGHAKDAKDGCFPLTR